MRPQSRPRARGVPAGCVSIPTRYVHMPSEMVDYRDVQGAVKLLVQALSGPIDIGASDGPRTVRLPRFASSTRGYSRALSRKAPRRSSSRTCAASIEYVNRKFTTLTGYTRAESAWGRTRAF